jgi:hypothetical protein
MDTADKKDDLYRSADENLQKLSLLHLEDVPVVMRSAPQILSAEVRSAEIRDKPSPVPDLPAYYEARSSFATENALILSDILSFLSELEVETQYKPKSYKIDCSFCQNSNSCLFKINLFQSTLGQYVVEIQRRSGCSLLTRKIFNAVSGRFVKKEKAKVIPSWGHVELDDETARILVLMVSNSGTEQQQEGFRLLSDIAGDKNSHQKILNVFGGATKIVSLVSEALNSRDLEAEHYAILLTANMCCGGSSIVKAETSKTQLEFQTQFVEKLFVPVSGIFTEVRAIGSLETKKQILRCLDSIPAALARDVKRLYAKTCREVPSTVIAGSELNALVTAAYGRFLDV